jgi:hypothetical protein
MSKCSRFHVSRLWERNMTTLCCGDNMVWIGQVGGGLYIKPRGEGDDWNNPL